MNFSVLRAISVSILLFSLLPVTALANAASEPPVDEVLYPVSYITLRNKTDDPDPPARFGDERDSIHVGQCTFSQASLSLLRPLSRNGLVYIPENLLSLEAVSEVEETVFWRRIIEQAQGQRPILYLHGYNTSFVKSCEQAALFQANLRLQNRLILFSWPSDGALLNYTLDEADLYWSVAPLEAVLAGMVERFGAGGFDVVAHSLGTRGLFLALVQLASRQNEALPLLNQLVLTAADIDVGIFKQHIANILPLVRNISVYVSDNDKPLALSAEVHGYSRLGQSGAHLKPVEGVEVIDISDVGVRSYSGHLYHLYHDSVMQDMDLLLNEGLRASQRETLTHAAGNRWRLKETEED